MSNPKTNETALCVMRSDNFLYFADIPVSYIGTRDSYLVVADMLHNILGSRRLKTIAR